MHTNPRSSTQTYLLKLMETFNNGNSEARGARSSKIMPRKYSINRQMNFHYFSLSRRNQYACLKKIHNLFLILQPVYSRFPSGRVTFSAGCKTTVRLDSRSSLSTFSLLDQLRHPLSLALHH